MNYALPPPPIWTPMDEYGRSLRGSGTSTIGGISSGVWPTVNLAIFYPFTLRSPAILYGFFWFVGATSSGNIDAGIYYSSLKKIISVGSTAMSATVNTPQVLDVTDTLLMPGEYLFGVACDNTTGTAFRNSSSDELVLPANPVYQQASAFPLPDPAVPEFVTNNAVPMLVSGMLFRSTF